MKLSDYVINYLADLGTRHAFVITGGAIMNVIDSFSKTDRISYICSAHEQAAAMAADAYWRVSGKLGIAMATSGPGATNLITGICCAYFDSIPALYITGQVNTYESAGKTKVRQVGFQETDIVSIVKPITKFAAKVNDPKKIRYYLDKAVHIATTGRQGPVLLDLPMDVQRAEIDPSKLKGFKPKEEKPDIKKIERQVEESIQLIAQAKRPVILFGAGVKLAKAQQEAKLFVEKLGFPFVLSWGAMDLFPHDHALFAGSFGVSASRHGNFTVQNSDLLIAIGSRLDTRQTGGKPDTFAREAKTVIVDIDKAELNKRRGFTPLIAINCDALLFLKLINEKLQNAKKQNISDWLKRIQEWKQRYPICLPEYLEQGEKVNPYVFMQALSEESADDDIIITDAGSNLTWTMQGYAVKGRQMLFSAFGNSPMGYSFPAAIGASVALNKKPIICIIGDGGIMMNLQELQTVATYKLPIKIFVLNNSGYGIIKQFQDVWLEGKYEASCPKCGVCFPDFAKVANAFAIKSEKIENHAMLREKVKAVLQCSEAVLCDVVVNPSEKITPKLEFGKPIEDQAPLLERKEFEANMIVKPVQEKGSSGI